MHTCIHQIPSDLCVQPAGPLPQLVSATPTRCAAEGGGGGGGGGGGSSGGWVVVSSSGPLWCWEAAAAPSYSVCSLALLSCFSPLLSALLLRSIPPLSRRCAARRCLGRVYTNPRRWRHYFIHVDGKYRCFPGLTDADGDAQGAPGRARQCSASAVI